MKSAEMQLFSTIYVTLISSGKLFPVLLPLFTLLPLCPLVAVGPQIFYLIH